MAKVHLCVRAQDQTLSRHKDSVMLQVTGLNKNLGNHIVGFQPTSQLLLIIEKMSFITKCFETPLKVSKVPWETFPGTCSEQSRCGKRLKNSALTLKSAGYPPVIALKRAQREKEKRSQNCIFPGSWPLASNSEFACVFFPLLACMG